MVKTHENSEATEYLPEDVAVAMTVVVEKRTLIVERSKNPNASTGTPISDLNGIARSLAMWIVKNPFGFQLAGVVVNDSKTREAITREQMRKFLRFVHDDNTYCKHYEAVYILFHTGMRISELCGLTLRDIDLQNRVVNIDHQLQRTSNMQYAIQSTKTNAGKRQILITEDVARCFQAIIEDRGKPKKEQFVDGYCGFLYFDEDGMPLVALHWEHRFNRMVKKYNEIYWVQMPNITPHVCRHTYCSNQAKSAMNPKTLQYLMGHSEIGVTVKLPYGHT